MVEAVAAGALQVRVVRDCHEGFGDRQDLCASWDRGCCEEAVATSRGFPAGCFLHCRCGGAIVVRQVWWGLVGELACRMTKCTRRVGSLVDKSLVLARE